MKSVTFTQVLLWLAYPLVIFFGIQHLQPRYVALLLAMLLIIRWRHEAKSLLSGLSQVYVIVFAALLTVVVLTTITNNETLLRLYPALVNAGMLFIFGYSLKFPPPMIERLARLHEPALDIAGVRYTRKVTQIWCVFFVLNGCVAVFTALCASRAAWSLYNGLIAYILMGVMFAGEWLVRQRIMLKNTKKWLK